MKQKPTAQVGMETLLVEKWHLRRGMEGYTKLLVDASERKYKVRNTVSKGKEYKG